MKVLLLILVCTISQILAQPGSYSEVPSSEYENDVRIQAALHYGARDVVQQGIQSGRLPDSTFKITQIFSVQRQVVNGLNYKFDVELSNGQMTVRANYVVYSPAGDGDLKVTDSSFNITSASNNILPILIVPPVASIDPVEEEENGILGGWSPVDLATLNTDSNLRDILNFGFQDFIAGLFDANYFIEDVVSIETQLVSGTNYKFNIIMGDDEGTEYTVTFTVYDEPWTGTRLVTESELVEDETQGEEEEPILGGWERVDVSELDTDQYLNEILIYGVQYVNDEGILPTSDYEPSEVYSIKKQLVSGTNYRFNLRLENYEDGYANVIIIVYDQPWTGTREVTYYFLDIGTGEDETAPEKVPSFTDNEDEEEDEEEDVIGGWTPASLTDLNTDSNLRDILSFGVQNAIVQGIEDGELPDAEYYIEDVVNIETQLVNGTNYRFTVVLGDDEGSEYTVTFIVYDQPWTDTRNFEGYEVAEDGEEEGEEPVLGGWEPVDVSELDSDQYLNEIFNYGVQEVVAQGIASNQLTNSNYQPSEIYSIKKQVVSGMNYRFNIRLENDGDGFATVIIVVWDQPWTGTRDVSYIFIDIQDTPAEETSPVIDGGAFDQDI